MEQFFGSINKVGNQFIYNHIQKKTWYHCFKNLNYTNLKILKILKVLI